MASKPISIQITGDAKKFNKEMAGVESKLGKLGGVAKVAGLAMAGGIAAGGAALFAVGLSFEEMRANIVKGTGASGEALEELYDSAKNVMSSVPDSGALVSTVLSDVNTFFGSTGTELENLSEGILDFSRLTGADASTAVGQLDAAMTQFNVGVGEADEVMGDFVRISQASGAPIDKLLGQMETFGPIFANAGFSLEETTAIFGQLEMAGVDVTRVGPALNKFFRDAADAGEDPRKALEEVQQAMLNAGSEAEALNIATDAFGAEGAQRMTSAIRNGSLDLENLNDLMGEGTGIVEEQTAATATFSDKWNEFKNKVLVKIEPLAIKLFDALEGGMEWLESDGIPAIESFIETLQGVAAWARENQDYIVGALVAIGTTVAVLLVPAFLAWAAGVIVATAPILALIVVVGAIGVAITYLWKNWDEVWNKIKTKTTEFAGAVKSKVSGLVDDVVGFVKGIPQKIRDLGQSFLDAGKSLGGKILSGIKSGLTSAIGFAGDVASGLWRAVKNAVNSNVVDKINNAIPNSITLPWPLGSIDLPDNPVPRLASGSRSFRGGMAIVGEQGPERVMLPRGSRVFTARETQEMDGSGGSTSVTINASTNADPVEIGRELGWVLRTRGR